MKKYKLLQPLPGIPAGSITIPHQGSFSIENFIKDETGFSTIIEKQWLTNKTWFQEVEERWKPLMDEHYHCVLSIGEPLSNPYEGNCEDLERINFGNCFRTLEQAEEAAKRIKKLLMEYHKEIGE